MDIFVDGCNCLSIDPWTVGLRHGQLLALRERSSTPAPLVGLVYTLMTRWTESPLLSWQWRRSWVSCFWRREALAYPSDTESCRHRRQSRRDHTTDHVRDVDVCWISFFDSGRLVGEKALAEVVLYSHYEHLLHTSIHALMAPTPSDP
jgi:hypothetical protein